MFQNIILSAEQRTEAVIALDKLMARWSNLYVTPSSIVYDSQYNELPCFVRQIIEERFPLPTDEREVPEAHRLYVLENLRRTLRGIDYLYGTHQSILRGTFHMI